MSELLCTLQVKKDEEWQTYRANSDVVRLLQLQTVSSTSMNYLDYYNYVPLLHYCTTTCPYLRSAELAPEIGLDRDI